MNGFGCSLKTNTGGCIIHGASGNQFVRAASTGSINNLAGTDPSQSLLDGCRFLNNEVDDSVGNDSM